MDVKQHFNNNIFDTLSFAPHSSLVHDLPDTDSWAQKGSICGRGFVCLLLWLWWSLTNRTQNYVYSVPTGPTRLFCLGPHLSKTAHRHTNVGKGKCVGTQMFRRLTVQVKSVSLLGAHFHLWSFTRNTYFKDDNWEFFPAVRFGFPFNSFMLPTSPPCVKLNLRFRKVEQCALSLFQQDLTHLCWEVHEIHHDFLKMREKTNNQIKKISACNSCVHKLCTWHHATPLCLLACLSLCVSHTNNFSGLSEKRHLYLSQQTKAGW